MNEASVSYCSHTTSGHYSIWLQSGGWGILKKLIKVHKPHTKRDLIFRIRKAWDMIPFATINKLVLSFENRINHMILKNGASIQDDLRIIELRRLTDSKT